MINLRMLAAVSPFTSSNLDSAEYRQPNQLGQYASMVPITRWIVHKTWFLCSKRSFEAMKWDFVSVLWLLKVCQGVSCLWNARSKIWVAYSGFVAATVVAGYHNLTFGALEDLKLFLFPVGRLQRQIFTQRAGMKCLWLTGQNASNVSHSKRRLLWIFDQISLGKSDSCCRVEN